MINLKEIARIDSMCFLMGAESEGISLIAINTNSKKNARVSTIEELFKKVKNIKEFKIIIESEVAEVTLNNGRIQYWQAI